MSIGTIISEPGNACAGRVSFKVGQVLLNTVGLFFKLNYWFQAVKYCLYCLV